MWRQTSLLFKYGTAWIAFIAGGVLGVKGPATDLVVVGEKQLRFRQEH